MECKKLLAAALLIAVFSLNVWAKKKPAKEAEAAASSELANDSEAATSALAAPDSSYSISAMEEQAPGQNYYITKDENQNLRFVQKLSWNKIEDIKSYRISIERSMDDGTWMQVLDKDLLENKIEVSLEPGKYRFHVSVINLFDQLEKSSDWKYFEVLKATQPKIDAAQADSIYLNSKKANGIFTIEGENLTSGTVFTMEQKDYDPPKILQGRVLSVDPEGKSAQVQFDIKEMQEGKCEIYATNPGGLSVISKTIQIKKKKERNWRFVISGGYTLPLTFFDGTFSDYTEHNFYPLSGTARMGVISFHTKYGDFGFGMTGNYSGFSNDTDTYSMSGHYVNGLAGLIWQKYLIPQKLCIDVHAGAGVALILGTRFYNKKYTYMGNYIVRSRELNSMALAFGGGLGVQYHPAKHFYMEAAVDFINAKFGGMNLGMFYPSVSIGGMF